MEGNHYGSEKKQVNLNVVRYLVDKQFEMIGETIRYNDLPEDGLLGGKKKNYWWDVYKFQSKKQYEEWKSWALSELEKNGDEDKFDVIDMTWGMNYTIQKIKEGQLELF